MGLYLCVFNEKGQELEGVEIGSYADFNFFRDTVVATVDQGVAGKNCKLLHNHSDSDGEWSSEEAKVFLSELNIIEEILQKFNPVEFNSEWKKQVAKAFGLKIYTLLDCFFDIDGEPLVERLKQLAQVSVDSGQPILFQ